MGKIIHRWRKWLDWNEYAKEKYNWAKRFLIFLGIIHNEWFEHFVNWHNEPLTEIENKTSPIMEMKTPSFPWQFTKEDLENNDTSPKWENGTEIRFDD